MALTAEEKAAAKAAKEQAAAEAKAAKEAEKAAAKAAASNATEATVHYNGETRTYSKEVHGDNFADLAKQFADQYEGAVIK